MAHTTRWRFGSFEIDLEASVLLRNGKPVQIGGQAFRALALLVSQGGRVVTREELQKAIWGDRVHVDFDRGLNVCIRQVRSALGDDAGSHRLIVTCPREGYRLATPVKRMGAYPSLPLKWWSAAAVAALIVTGYLLAPAGPTTDDSAAPVNVSPLQNPVPFSPEWLTRNIDAYTLYWRARGVYDRSEGRKAFGALRYLERAIALDSNFALAQAGVAVSYVNQATAGIATAASAIKARQSAARALALSGRSAEAHIALAEVSYRLDGNDLNAEGEFLRAVQLDGHNAYVRQRYAAFLKERRRFDDALDQLRVAEELDPLSLISSWQKSEVLFFARRYEEALTQARHTLGLDPTHPWSYRTIGECLEALGRPEEAIEAYQRAGAVALGHLGRAYAVSGQDAAARQILQILARRPIEELGHTGVATAYIYAGLGESATAMQSLETAQRDGVRLPFSLRLAPQWDPLRTSHAFNELLKNNNHVAGT